MAGLCEGCGDGLGWKPPGDGVGPELETGSGTDFRNLRHSRLFGPKISEHLSYLAELGGWGDGWGGGGIGCGVCTCPGDGDDIIECCCTC